MKSEVKRQCLVVPEDVNASGDVRQSFGRQRCIYPWHVYAGQPYTVVVLVRPKSTGESFAIHSSIYFDLMEPSFERSCYDDICVVQGKSELDVLESPWAWQDLLAYAKSHGAKTESITTRISYIGKHTFVSLDGLYVAILMFAILSQKTWRLDLKVI